MKILHTADLHLGNVLYGYERINEEMDVLKQISHIINEEQPDAMIISGDIFNNYAPSMLSQRMYLEAILDMHKQKENMSIIITAGNHDSPTRIEITEPLWKYFNVHTIGQTPILSSSERDFLNNDDKQIESFIAACYEKYVIEIKRQDILIGYVIAIPYSNNKNITKFANLLLSYVQKRNIDSLPVVLSVHLALMGSKLSSGNSRADDFTWFDYSSIDEAKYDYLALGHIHFPQTLQENKARYSGSPLAVSFNEQYLHSVSLVEVKHGKKPQIETRTLIDSYSPITFPNKPTSIEEVFHSALESKEKLKNHYIRFNILLDEDYLPYGSKEKAIKIAEEAGGKFCVFNIERTKNIITRAEVITTEEFQRLEPKDVMLKYLEESGRNELEDLDELLKQAMEVNYEN